MRTTMWLVRRRDSIYNAFPRKLTAEVYASGFSDSKNVEIIEGEFIYPDTSQQSIELDELKECDHCGQPETVETITCRAHGKGHVSPSS